MGARKAALREVEVSDERLIGSSANPATRRLLEAGVREEPPALALATVAAALGVAGALPGVASAAAASGVVSTAAASGGGLGAAQVGAGSAIGAAAPVATGTKLGSVLFAAGTTKWFAVGALLGGVTSAGHWAVTRPPERAHQASVVAQAPAHTAGPAARRAKPPAPLANVAPATEPTPDTAPGVVGQFSAHDEGAPKAAPRVVAPRPERASNSPAPAPDALRAAPVASGPASVEGQSASAESGALARETELIDQARKALGENDPARAAALLDKYNASTRIGVLDREALLLRIEAAVQRGAFEHARTLANRFRNTYPRDAHLARLDALLERTDSHDGSGLGTGRR
jgi:hypothetical protein